MKKDNDIAEKNPRTLKDLDIFISPIGPKNL
jgi:hypothetical protein